MPAKKSKKQRKWGRNSRRLGGGAAQFKRTERNKTNSVLRHARKFENYNSAPGWIITRQSGGVQVHRATPIGDAGR